MNILYLLDNSFYFIDKEGTGFYKKLPGNTIKDGRVREPKEFLYFFRKFCKENKIMDFSKQKLTFITLDGFDELDKDLMVNIFESLSLKEVKFLEEKKLLEDSSSPVIIYTENKIRFFKEGHLLEANQNLLNSLENWITLLKSYTLKNREIKVLTVPDKLEEVLNIKKKEFYFFPDFFTYIKTKVDSII